MESNNYLGIYLGQDKATVVCLSSRDRNRKVLSCFSVSIGQQDGQTVSSTTPVDVELAALIAHSCAQRELQFSHVAVALDCSMFMQHDVHSDFSDPKKIAATVRFDAEEALSADVTDIAVAFRIAATGQNGSDLTVFTAQQKTLSDVLLSMQNNDLDPVTIEPDVNSLSRFLEETLTLPEPQNPATLFGILSDRRGYLVARPESQRAATLRTFLINPTQDRNDLLQRETLLTTALTENGEPTKYLKVFDSTNSVDYQQLSNRLNMQAGDIDLTLSLDIEPQALADCADPVDVAIAYGAAMAHLDKTQTINFRNDFMPYQGQKERLKKTVKFLSVCVTILLFAVGLYFQVRLFQENRKTGRIRTRLAQQYASVMFGKKPSGRTSPVRQLSAELRRIRDVKSGQLNISGEESISAKLTLVLGAFNECAAATNLSIDTISIAPKSITVVGDTSSRKNTLKFFDAVRGSGLEILRYRYDQKGGRDTFSVTAEPKK
ncbi:MAG: hypothetical protein JSU70_20670 [Phycisphaerales bacterium]|nr:MAG: hypothetical protein JSU70_20670 [Phycisphaerales bacterium]